MNFRLLIALFFLFVGCRDDDPQPEAPVCMEDNSIEGMKKWYFFNIGSSWHYVEHNSGAVDHVEVIDYIEEYYSNDRFYLSVLYESSFYNWQHILESSDEGLINLSDDLVCKRRLIKETREDINSYIFPVNVGESYGSVQWRVVDFYLNHNAGTDLQFNKVLKLVHPFYKLGGTRAYTEMWIAEGVGVVRIYRPGQNEDWRLFDYNIVE